MSVSATGQALQPSASLLQRLTQARARADELFRIVKREALYDRPISQRHRIIFYVGHLETFDWNLLGTRFFGLASFASDLDQLFAFGIDPVDGGLPTDQPHDWPGLEEVAAYNARLRNSLDARLDESKFEQSGKRSEELAQLLNVAVEHRLMHAETLAYMLHQLPIDRKSCIGRALVPSVAPALLQPAVPHMVTIPAGNATLGLKRGKHGTFGWDNEFEEHVVSVPSFRIDAYPVTQREFLRFVEAGGYQECSLWNNSDWEWLQSSGTTHPAFWLRRDNQWFHCGMFDEVPLPLEWPVSVSHAEAAAYARWVGKDLPTEAEWHRAAYGSATESVERAFPWGDDGPDSNRGNFDFAGWEPTPVGSFPAGASAFGVHDLLGNGWEWTRTVFAPFMGFEPFPFYPAYSANFFDGQHYVMKGGSWRTAACMLRRSFRNWFQPHYPFVYGAFRCVER